jgi:hypothetical protein
MSKALKKALIYTRTAAGGMDEIREQEEISRQYCDTNELAVHAVYADFGRDRASFCEMKAAIASGQSNCVVVPNVERLGRDMRTFVELIATGVELHSAINGLLSTADVVIGSLGFTMDRDKRSARIKAGIAFAKERRRNNWRGPHTR